MDWLTDEEIIRCTMNKHDATELEQALAKRLGDALDDIAGLKASNDYWNPHAGGVRTGVC